jgi:hypothetical protein
LLLSSRLASAASAPSFTSSYYHISFTPSYYYSFTSSYYYICVLALILYMCPTTIYISSYYYYICVLRPAAVELPQAYICVLDYHYICVLLLYVSSYYYYICVLSPQTCCCRAPACLYMCPRTTTIYVSSVLRPAAVELPHAYICVLVLLLYMICVLSPQTSCCRASACRQKLRLLPLALLARHARW